MRRERGKGGSSRIRRVAHCIVVVATPLEHTPRSYSASAARGARLKDASTVSESRAPKHAYVGSGIGLGVLPALHGKSRAIHVTGVEEGAWLRRVATCVSGDGQEKNEHWADVHAREGVHVPRQSWRPAAYAANIFVKIASLEMLRPRLVQETPTNLLAPRVADVLSTLSHVVLMTFAAVYVPP